MTMVTELFLLFLISLGLSIVLTPMARSLGIKLGAMDIPMERKVHSTPIPRIGGLAVFFAFMFTCCIGRRFFPYAGNLYDFSFNTFMGQLGGVLILICGLWDDFRRLKPWTKFFFQILVATLAFLGGATITGVLVGGYGIVFNAFFSYVVTVFWFLLFINAVNLIDGLDGLAGGLVFFTCLVMAISTYSHSQYLITFYFVILGGAILGFLKYNFNPASIFLGDGGSYFLGYVVAILAIRSSAKGPVGVLMLIPLLALGVPIFDAILSPIRRFVRGRPMFQADKGHIHHVFLRLGLSSRNVVLIIYGMTMMLCLLAISLMVLRDRNIEGLVFGVLLIVMIFLVRKMGYLEYLAFDKFYGWFKDMTDVAGLSQARRSFLSLQIAANKSPNMEELWVHIGELLKMLKFDKAELHYMTQPVRYWDINKNDEQFNTDHLSLSKREVNYSDNLMILEIPLIDGDPDIFGKLILFKDVKKGHLESFTIRRVEHLRRTLLANLIRLKGNGEE
jgi:UDP-GlcNAc:undecaprenyl-phosphate GlcNAc-1-phosphate transferase